MVDRVFENLCAPKKPTRPSTKGGGRAFRNARRRIPLRDCGFRENEVVVAAIDGSSERAVLEGIGPLLGNEKILKTLKRARRSRRGLKFVRGKADKSSYASPTLQRRKPKKEDTDEKHPNAVPNIDSDKGKLVDEYCHDYDPLCDVSEYQKQLLVGLLAIGSGTVVFSALGL
jgi:hypothetical protein